MIERSSNGGAPSSACRGGSPRRVVYFGKLPFFICSFLRLLNWYFKRRIGKIK